MHENELSSIIIGKAIEVHSALGPGLLESTYQECLCYELQKDGFLVEKEKSLPIIYKELMLEHAYRIDLLVEKKVVVELKAVSELNEVHKAQVLTYLKFSGCKLGLLINFNSKLLKDNICRYVNKL